MKELKKTFFFFNLKIQFKKKRKTDKQTKSLQTVHLNINMDVIL